MQGSFEHALALWSQSLINAVRACNLPPGMRCLHLQCRKVLDARNAARSCARVQGVLRFKRHAIFQLRPCSGLHITGESDMSSGWLHARTGCGERLTSTLQSTLWPSLMRQDPSELATALRSQKAYAAGCIRNTRCGLASHELRQTPRGSERDYALTRYSLSWREPLSKPLVR